MARERVRRAAAALLLVLAGTTPAAARQAPRELAVVPGDAGALQRALRTARDGDRIVVRRGVHRVDPVTVDRSVTIVGEAGAVLESTGAGGLLHITVPGVTVRNLTLRGVPSSHVKDNAAILVDDGDGCVIEDNRLESNFFGIYIARSRDCRIARNTISATSVREATSGNGIHLWNATDALIEGNVVRGHRDGLYLEHVRGTTLRGNVSEDNLRYGLHFMFSSGNRYIGNTFRRNGAGVAVMYSKDVLVLDNTFEDNWGAAAYGLLLKEIGDSRIEGNVFRRNTVAVSSEGSTGVTFTRNRFIANGWAARVLASSRDNHFTDNDFIENTFDVTTNSRTSFNTFAGNYWSRYSGYDLTGDGYGDVPHRPVRLFSLLVQRAPAALVLLRSAFVDVLEVAERVAPVLTPATLVDERPRMREAVR
jgi:nitrous oxidase accessory protein